MRRMSGKIFYITSDLFTSFKRLKILWLCNILYKPGAHSTGTITKYFWDLLRQSLGLLDRPHRCFIWYVNSYIPIQTNVFRHSRKFEIQFKLKERLSLNKHFNVGLFDIKIKTMRGGRRGKPGCEVNDSSLDES